MSKLAFAVVVMLAQVASAEPNAPDDRYVKALAGKPLVEGQGFAGVLELGTPTPQMYKAFGAAREAPSYMFWYFYDKGPWTLTVVADMSPTNDFTTRAIEIAGKGAPATKRGVHIGDSLATVTKIYGAGETFSGTVGSAKFKTADVDVEAPYKRGIYYPKLATLFVMTAGKVEKIVVVTTPPKGKL